MSVTLSIADHVATIVLDRPPVNALTRDTYREIAARFLAVRDDREVRAVVLTAAGSKAFSAGADLKAMGPDDLEAETPSVRLDRGRVIRDLLSAIAECPVPVVCAVNGAAIGAGAGIASMCDIILAATGARFGFTEINVGLLGGLAHLELMVGRYRARALYFTGALIEAEELQRIGMVHRVVEPARLQAEAQAIARTIAEKSPIAVRLAKEAMTRIEAFPVMDAYRVEQDYTNRLLRFEDSTEARRAMLEKRPPVWRWR